MVPGKNNPRTLYIVTEHVLVICLKNYEQLRASINREMLKLLSLVYIAFKSHRICYNKDLSN